MVRGAHLALGGVAHKPWVATDAEQALVGARADRGTFEAAAQNVIRDAHAHDANDFKIPLAQTLVARTLHDLATAGG
jgi:xanthine dehydrogenase YagS FAD-binding subunit